MPSTAFIPKSSLTRFCYEEGKVVRPLNPVISESSPFHLGKVFILVGWALWRGKVSALVLQVSATQACGINLAFSMCLHCTDENHTGRNRGSPVCSLIAGLIYLQTWSVWLPNCWALFTGVTMLFSLCAKLITCKQVVWALWRGKVSALVRQVLATQACGINLAFSMCLIQCLHCTDDAHIGRNRGSPFCSLIPVFICLQTWPVWLPNCWALFTGVTMLFSLCAKLITCLQMCLSTLAWWGACTCSASVSHPGMWYTACFCHVSAPVSTLHWWGPYTYVGWNRGSSVCFIHTGMYQKATSIFTTLTC